MAETIAPPAVNPAESPASAPAPAAAPRHRYPVEVEDYDAGFKELPLEYLRGSPPEGFPSTIRVRQLTHVEARRVARAMMNRKPDAEPGEVADWFAAYLLPSLPPELATAAFLDRLTMQCVAQLEYAAWALANGMPAQVKLREAVNSALDQPAPVAPAPA